MEYYIIDFGKTVYIYDFYNIIVPKLRDYFNMHADRELIFNFSDLEFLSPNVIPHIFNIAEIYKQYCKKKLIIHFSWNVKVLAYFDALHFFQYAESLDIIEYNKEMVGGFKSYKTIDNCRFEVIQKNSSETLIIDQVQIIMQVMNRIEKKDKEFYSNYESLAEILFHLIHNSTDILRGNSNTYVIFQLNNYNKKYFAYLSVCDNGVGIKSTIKNKFLSGEDKRLFQNRNDNTFMYILEAIFWRKYRKIFNEYVERHGIYQITDIVLKRNGIIGIHSNDTYTSFNCDNFYAPFTEISEAINKNDLKSINEIDYKNIYSKSAKTKKYKGVHIDIEFPIGE